MIIRDPASEPRMRWKTDATGAAAGRCAQPPPVATSLVYRQSAWTRAHALDLGDQPVLPAADRPADLQRASDALYRRPVGLRLRQRSARHARREHARGPGRLYQSARRALRHHRRARRLRRRGTPGRARLSGLGDHPVRPGSGDRPRRAFLLRLAAVRHAAGLARWPASSTATSGATSLPASAISAACRATSSTMRS